MKPVAKGLVIAVALGAALPTISVRTVFASTTFYVSPTGSDANPGTSASPFKTIEQCATAMLHAGDTCVINSGTYRETVTPLVSGTTYQAATGATVTVDGTDYVNGWSQVTSSDLSALEQTNPYLSSSPFATQITPTGSTVFKAHAVLSSGTVPNSLQSPLVPGSVGSVSLSSVNNVPPANQIFVNGQMQNEAQWPNPSYDTGTLRATPLSPNVEITQAGSTLANIVDSKLNQSLPGYWTGAHVYVQQGFMADTGVVTASAPGNIAVAGYFGPYVDHWDFMCGGIQAGNTRYFLWGKLSELDAPTEWFYDDTSSTLYFRPASGTVPADNTVTAKKRQLAFDLATNNVSNTTITGLHIFGATIRTGSTSSGNTLDSLQVDYPSHFMDFYKDPGQTNSSSCDDLSAGVTTSGIILDGTNNTVKNSTIEYSAGNGVALLGSNNTAQNNYIHDVDYSGGRGAGVWVIGDSQTIKNNTIAYVGRAGIESNSNVQSRALTNGDISLNDISYFGMLEQDDGAIYTCCNLNMSGTDIHHNWLHDAQTYKGVPHRATIGVYIDGGSNGGAGGLNIYENVGWNISSGTVALVSANPVVNTKVLNNDGGVWLFQISSWDSLSKVDNTIGQIAEVQLGSGVTPHLNSNFGDVNAHDPKYVDEGAHNYALQSGSLANGTGISDSPGTDDCTGTCLPSYGAYQQGVSWVPGASGRPAPPVEPRWGASGMTATGSWNYPSTDTAAPIGRMDSHPTNPYADLWTGQSGTQTGSLHFTLTTPTSGLHTIDHVYVLIYARMHRNLSTTAGNVVVTMPTIGTVFNANGADFEDIGVPFKYDITSAVAGNPLLIPTSADVAVTLDLEPQLGVSGQVPYSSVDVYALEILVEAH